jgi:fumarate reductase flavoprotein subunit
MGGIRINKYGQAYGLKNLYSLGESACWDLHGFNRLGGNSLAETVVAGKIIGEKIAEYTQDVALNVSSALVEEHLGIQQSRIDKFLSGDSGTENVYELRTEMEQLLNDNVHVFRNAEHLEKAVAGLKEVHERAQYIGLRGARSAASPELAAALRLPGMIKLALTIASGALNRTESRGSHFRDDYPKRDDENWLKRTLAYWPEGAKAPTLDYESVTITESPPGDRGYGEATAGPKDK